MHNMHMDMHSYSSSTTRVVCITCILGITSSYEYTKYYSRVVVVSNSK